MQKLEYGEYRTIGEEVLNSTTVPSLEFAQLGDRTILSSRDGVSFHRPILTRK